MKRMLFTLATFFLLLSGFLSGCDLILADQHFIVNEDLPRILEVGSELPDFKEFVTLQDQGTLIPVTDDMVDASSASTAQIGSFYVTYTYEKEDSSYRKILMFVVTDTEPHITQVNADTNLEIGSVPDFIEYITAKDYHDQPITITEAMVDHSAADTTKAGSFTVYYHVTDSENHTADFEIHFQVASMAPTIVKAIVGTELTKGSIAPDFKAYIEATDYKGNKITITDAMVDTSKVDMNTIGQFAVRYHVTDNEGHSADFEIIFSVVASANFYKAQGYPLLKDKTSEHLLNSLGEAKVLVVPIDFANDTGTSWELENIRKGFFGTSDQVKFESVKSYYDKSSFGKMNLTGEVLDWYHAPQNYQYYQSQHETYNQDSDQLLIKNALTYYTDNGMVDLADYDLDRDGYVDAIWAVYSAPIDRAADSIFLWAYQYAFSSSTTVDSKKLGIYAWASVDFLKEGGELTNARTYIHETGHLIGLEDYYDYDETSGANGGLGGADMMDYNTGDHNSFSKLLLGWINPYIINASSVTMSLKSYSDTGEVILIPVSWNNNIFTEYYLIEFFTPTGLNADNNYLTGYGIRVLHVIATIGTGGISGEYYTMYNYDNSDTSRKLITMMRGDGSLPFNSADSFAGNSDLYHVNETGTFSTYNGVSLFSLKVNLITTSTSTITFNILN